MSLVYVTEVRFARDKEGRVFANSSFDNELLSKYIEVFNHVHVVARIMDCDVHEGDMVYVPKIHGLDFIDFPYFVGLKDFILKRKQLEKHAKLIISKFSNEKFLCRIPGNLGNLIIKELVKRKAAYSVEVVGDPWDVFAPGSVRHLFRPFIRLIATLHLKRNVRNSFATLYVTQKSLQRRYPAINSKLIVSSSDVILNSLDFVYKPKTFSKKSSYNLISIGSLDQMYKSPDVVLNAIKRLHDKGIYCNLQWLVGGKYLESMKSLSFELGISDFVDFKGNVDKDILRTALFQSDVFVLASKTEGLPRSVIEAMAAGLPCIGTNVGGIPELLANEALIKKNSIQSLTLKIEEFLQNPSLYNQQALRNFEEAQNYKDEILAQRRILFYKFILENL